MKILKHQKDLYSRPIYIKLENEEI